MLLTQSALKKKKKVIAVFLPDLQAFTVAETRLGVSALLDPKELVSNKVPDGLSIVTYLSQLYFYFNRKSLGGLCSSEVSVFTFITFSRQQWCSGICTHTNTHTHTHTHIGK